MRRAKVHALPTSAITVLKVSSTDRVRTVLLVLPKHLGTSPCQNDGLPMYLRYSGSFPTVKYIKCVPNMYISRSSR